ncbi:MAG: pilus assembly PilX N-terminal domain-containing protein [Candidatus Omnitrophota bacterium]
MNKRGIALVLSYMVIAVLTILGTGFITRAVSERNIARRYVNSVNAFWMCESGISRALSEMRTNFEVSGTGLWSGALSQGSYSVDVEVVGSMRKVTVHGFSPATGPTQAERIVEVMLSGGTPSNFFDNVVYSAGDVTLNGDTYIIDGDVIYADTINDTDHITGTVINEPEASPLALFDFEELRAISQTQGNVYNDARLDDVQDGSDSFPTDFWFSDPTDPTDPTTGEPNVVYIEADLKLNGSIGTIGGFFVVVGDVVTNPGAVEDLTINGNGQIEGIIYTRGQFRINGGGGNLNVDGGVWAGTEVRLNGNAEIAYNQDYMTAIDALDIDVQVQIASWRDTQNPFKISP